jgi:hypothetical protein
MDLHREFSFLQKEYPELMPVNLYFQRIPFAWGYYDRKTKKIALAKVRGSRVLDFWLFVLYHECRHRLQEVGVAFDKRVYERYHEDPECRDLCELDANNWASSQLRKRYPQYYDDRLPTEIFYSKLLQTAQNCL